ncbi:hypothetical protein ES332_D11G142500v1 [Gossypium tomentosum]|uniref:Uncharacterized protein n=1 Tax=Gossypium tomentosum TaxID=34277 RepID=A0A5D2IMZ6_GOSTO|nr:hypothetical protein ES332_D11G142500v1 [Gossypium tomentosum]
MKKKKKRITSRNLDSCSTRLSSARIRCLPLVSAAEPDSCCSSADDAVSDSITTLACPAWLQRSKNSMRLAHSKTTADHSSSFQNFEIFSQHTVKRQPTLLKTCRSEVITKL